MIVLDANILLYTYLPSDPRHRAAVEWFETTLNGSEAVGLPWVSIWAFLRVSTNARLQDRPGTTEEVMLRVQQWLDFPGVTVLSPGRRHKELLADMMRGGQVSGPDITDAALAALALENGATLATTDRGFARFPRLKWLNPLD